MNFQISICRCRYKIFTCILFLFIAQACWSQETTISYPQAFPKEVADDIQSLLQAATGQQWRTQQEKPSDEGVILLINTSLNYKTGESCQINSDGSSFVKFEAPTTNGLIYGIYKYLRDLGFKFYLPDSLYTIVPSLKSAFRKTSVMETPFLRIRDFFGTGGFGSGKTDPGRNVEKAWRLWKWRNGFGAEFILAGHVGENFNLANANELAAHPDWTATPLVKNGKVDVSTKLNYYNDKAVDFFTDWVIKKYTDKNYKAPPAYIRDMVSIEPADGAGFMDPQKGSDLKTVSDQVFYAANVAAKKLDQLFPNQPNIGVNLYAYSGHADVPDFSLNPRVFVQIIPYQFQNIAYGPAFIQRWSKKVKRFGLYDYFKYPDSYWDMPGGYNIDQLMKRAINAAEAGSEGTSYESSYSKFATAIPLWVLSQYMCSGDDNWQKNYDELIRVLYGDAAPSVKKLFDIFYSHGQFVAADLDESMDLIDEAQRSSKDPQVALRINDLKLYLGYVSLYLQSQDLSNGDLEQRMMPVEKMAWTLYQTKIIDSYRIMQLASYSFLNAKTTDKAMADRYHKLHLVTFPESNDPDVVWKKDYQYSTNETDKLASRKNFSRRTRTALSNVSEAPATMADQIAEAKNNYQSKRTITLQGNSLNRGYFNLFAEKPGSIVINWSLTNSKGQAPTATISGTDKNYKAVYDYPLQGSSGKLNISIPAGESYFFVNAGANTVYTLQLQPNEAFCYFDGSPRGKMSFLDEKGTPSYDPAYFPSYTYIPKNISEVQYRVQANALKILTPDGNAVSTNLVSTSPGGFELRTFGVPAGFSGKFWIVAISGNYNYQFLNIPDRYFLLTKK